MFNVCILKVILYLNINKDKKPKIKIVHTNIMTFDKQIGTYLILYRV